MNVKNFGFKSYVGLRGEVVYAMRMTKSSKNKIFSFLADFLVDYRVEFRDGYENETDNRIEWWQPNGQGMQFLYFGEYIVLRGGVERDGEFEFKAISNFAVTESVARFQRNFLGK